jgi:hypothetical protein
LVRFASPVPALAGHALAPVGGRWVRPMGSLPRGGSADRRDASTSVILKRNTSTHLTIAQEVQTMPDTEMQFSNRVGQELFELLAKRGSEQLNEASDFDRFTAMLGAALLAVAEVLRLLIKDGQNADKLVDFSARWLRTFLEPASGKRGT